MTAIASGQQTYMAATPSPRALRILYVWDSDYPWDVRVEKICLTLRAAGHEVHILARNRARDAERESLPEGIVHRMRPWRWAGRLDALLGFPAFFSPRWISFISRIARSTRPDVIIVRDLPLCPTALWIGRRYAIPVVLDMAEHYPAMMQKIFDEGRQRAVDHLVRNPRAVAAVERYCLRRLDRVLVVIEEMRDRLVRMGVPASRIDVVSNTPSTVRVSQRHAPLRSGSDPLQLVYLGIMESPRGVGDLVEAAALLRDSGLRVRVRLVGTGREHRLFEQWARELGVYGKEVEFLGHIKSHENALRVLASSDIGVLPHRRNEHWDHTIPNKLFDYMAAGLAVVTSDAVPFARIVRDTHAGEVFVSRSPQSLADAIKRLANADRRQTCGANGQRAVLSRYNWEHDGEELLVSVAATVAQRRTARRPTAPVAGQ